MKITKRQLRGIIREQVVQSMRFDPARPAVTDGNSARLIFDPMAGAVLEIYGPESQYGADVLDEIHLDSQAEAELAKLLGVEYGTFDEHLETQEYAAAYRKAFMDAVQKYGVVQVVDEGSGLVGTPEEMLRDMESMARGYPSLEL